MDNDNVTSDATPTIFIQTDVLNFVDTNNNGLFQDPDTARRRHRRRTSTRSRPPRPTASSTTRPCRRTRTAASPWKSPSSTRPTGTFVTGFAEAVIAALTGRVPLHARRTLTPGVYLVTARTRVFDGQATPWDPDQETGRSNASPPLRGDRYHRRRRAARRHAHRQRHGHVQQRQRHQQDAAGVSGHRPANSKVRIFAKASGRARRLRQRFVCVGHAVGGIGGLANDGLGLWEITVEPLADGKYNFFCAVRDGLGIVGDPVAIGLEPLQQTRRCQFRTAGRPIRRSSCPRRTPPRSWTSTSRSTSRTPPS